MKALIGFSTCHLSREAFAREGFEAYSCDLLPARGDDPDPEMHLECDIWDVLHQPWDVAVLHPMCTYLTCSAAWAYKDPDYDKYPGIGYHQRPKESTLLGAERRAAREKAIEEFKALMALPFPKAVENPANSFLNKSYRPPDQKVHPYQFGDNASKNTGFWLDQLPPLFLPPELYIPPRMVGSLPRWDNQTDSGQNAHGVSDNRWLLRSETFPGIATAFGQWARYVKLGEAWM